MTEELKKRKILTGWSWFWLFVVFAILLTIGLQKCGISMIQRTEDSEIIQKPHQ